MRVTPSRETARLISSNSAISSDFKLAKIGEGLPDMISKGVNFKVEGEFQTL